MHYCVYILNRLARKNLGWRTPMEKAFGPTPDISNILCFYFYQPVLYNDPDTVFPASKERSGRFVGFSDNVGDALTFQILTDDTQKVIHRSVVRAANDIQNPNNRMFPVGGEISDVSDQTNIQADDSLQLISYADTIEPTRLKLPTVDAIDVIGKTFLREREADGTLHRAEVMHRIDTVKGVENHKKIGNKWEVLMRWEDESESQEPIGLIAKSDPVSLAKYAEENNVLDLPGWKNKKKFKRMMKQVRMYSMRHGPRIKFGVRVPKDYIEAMEFDQKNQNNLWKDAVNMEMKQVYEYDSFRSKGKKAQVPKDHVMIRVHFIFDVKQDGRHKARLVAGGHLTGPKVDTYYSSVVSLRSMRIVIFLSELNKVELCSGDIGNAYFEAYTKEKICFMGGKEFAP